MSSRCRHGLVAAWRALRALCIIPQTTEPRSECIAGAVARQASRSKRESRASSVWDARDGAEGLRTHPAAREAQLTCAQRDLQALARGTQNQATAARASEHPTPTLHSHTHHTHLRPRLAHAVYILPSPGNSPTSTTAANTNTTTTSSPPSAYGLAIPPGYIANHRPILALT